MVEHSTCLPWNKEKRKSKGTMLPFFDKESQGRFIQNESMERLNLMGCFLIIDKYVFLNKNNEIIQIKIKSYSNYF